MTPEQKAKKNAKQRAYYAQNKEREIAKQKERRKLNPEKYKAQRAKRYWQDPDKARNKARAYYEANKDRAAAVAREYRKHNKDKRRMQRRFLTYGITKDAFYELWNLQSGRCAICLDRLADDESRTTHVDHDHKTGAVRGLLCSYCNSGLGWFRDNPVWMQRGSAYILKLL